MNRRVDSVVIGGGCTGASIAFNLAKSGLTNTVLLEKNYLSSGATGRSAGIVRTHYSHKETVKLALESLRFFHDFEHTMKVSCEFVPIGFFLLVGPAGERSLEANVALQQGLGVNTKLLGADDLTLVEPFFRYDDAAAIAFEPDSGYASTDLTTRAFAESARLNGAEILQGTEVERIKCSAGEVQAVVTAEGELRTPIVILAASMWTRKLAADIGLEIPIRTRKSYLSFIQWPKNFGSPHPVIADSITGIYARPAGGQTWVGGVPPDRYGIEPDFFESTLPQSLISSVSEKVAHRMPSLANGKLIGGYVAVNDETPDDYPILSSTPIRGLYIAAGFSGHGFKLSPAVGRVMAELILKGKVNGIDHTQYRLSRFEEGEPIPPNEGYRVQFFPKTQQRNPLS